MKQTSNTFQNLIWKEYIYNFWIASLKSRSIWRLLEKSKSSLKFFQQQTSTYITFKVVITSKTPSPWMKISKRRSREMVLIDILTAGEFVYLRCTISRHSTRPFNFQTSFFLFFSKLLCSRHCHNVDFFSINRGLTFAILKFYYSLWKSTKKQEKNNCMIFFLCVWSSFEEKHTNMNEELAWAGQNSVKVWSEHFSRHGTKKFYYLLQGWDFFYNFILNS